MKTARKLVFRKNLTYAALDKDGTELWAGTFNLDPTATPKVWDHRSNEVAKKGGDTLGIYELNGDTLKVCSVAGTWKEKQWTGKRRPTAGPRAGRRRGRRGVQGSRGGDVNSLGLLKRR